MGLPKVHVSFTEAAKTFTARSNAGIVGLILRDAVPASNPVVVINNDDIPSTLTDANKKQIEMALMGAEQPPQKVIAYVISADGNGIVLDKASIGLAVNGSTVRLNATTSPQDAQVTWTSEDTSIATVSSGTVTAVAAGETSITAKITVDGTEYTATCDVKVAAAGETPEASEDSDATLIKDYSEALEYFASVRVDYLAAPNVAIDNQVAAIQQWITTERADGRVVKAVLPNTAADNIGIINYTTENVIVDDEESYTTAQYCSRIAGVLASIPITESSTFKALDELTGCTKLSKSEMDTAIDAGKLIVFWDGEKVKVGRGVNSFQTTTKTMGTQFKKIRIVNVMDTIQQDIRMLAEDSYIGRFTNTYANKCLLVAAVGDYLAELEKQGVLSVKECDIDEDANKNYLIKKGIDVSEMTDVDIREANTDDKVFMKATISIYDAIEDIVLPITV